MRLKLLVLGGVVIAGCAFGSIWGMDALATTPNADVQNQTEATTNTPKLKTGLLTTPTTATSTEQPPSGTSEVKAEVKTKATETKTETPPLVPTGLKLDDIGQLETLQLTDLKAISAQLKILIERQALLIPVNQKARAVNEADKASADEARRELAELQKQFSALQEQISKVESASERNAATRASQLREFTEARDRALNGVNGEKK